MLETADRSPPAATGAEALQPSKRSATPTPETQKFQQDSKEIWDDLVAGRGLIPKTTTKVPKIPKSGKYLDPALNLAEASGLPVPARPPSENRRADIRKTPNLAASIRKIQAESLTEGERLRQENKELFESLARERGINLEELYKITPQTSEVNSKPPDVRCIIPGSERTPVDDNFDLLDYEEDQGPFISELELPPTPGKGAEIQIQEAVLNQAAEKLKTFVKKHKDKTLKQKSLKLKVLEQLPDESTKKSTKGKTLVKKPVEKPIEWVTSIAKVAPVVRTPQPQPGPSNQQTPPSSAVRSPTERLNNIAAWYYTGNI